MVLEQIRQIAIEAVGKPQIIFYADRQIVAHLAQSGIGVFHQDPNIPSRWVATVDPRYDFDSVLKYMVSYGNDAPEWLTAEVVTFQEPPPDTTQGFVAEFQQAMERVHQNAVDKGFWENQRNDGEAIALIHSELSEALESLRKGDPPDKHLPEYGGTIVELADAIIRIMDLAQARHWPLAEAILAKMVFNATRERKHGKEF